MSACKISAGSRTHVSVTVGADADLGRIPIGDCAMANKLCEPSILNFGAFQPAHDKPGAWLKSASASTGEFRRWAS